MSSLECGVYEGDAKVIHHLRASAAEALTAEHGEGYWSRVIGLPTLKKHIAAGEVYLARSGDDPVGTFQLSTRKIGFYHKAWFVEPDAPSLYLTNMAIGADYWRCGIGRDIMKYIEAKATAESIRSIRFDAYNASAGAGEFYEKCGYTEVHRGSINNIALIYFEKVMSDGV